MYYIVALKTMASKVMDYLVNILGKQVHWTVNKFEVSLITKEHEGRSSAVRPELIPVSIRLSDSVV